MAAKGEVIVLTGTPGTGKSTIGSILALKLGSVQIDLSEYAKREGLIVGVDESRSTEIVDIRGLRRKLSKFISKDLNVVIEGHYAQDVVPDDLSSLVIVLRRAPWVLKRELTRRGYSPEKVWENVEVELLGTCLIEALQNYSKEKVCEIDTTYISAQKAVDIILELLKSREKCTYGKIDWMEHPETEILLRDL